MMKVSQAMNLRHSRTEGRHTLGSYDGVGYIMAGSTDSSAGAIKRKCLEWPGFLMRSRQVLFGERALGSDRIYARES